MTNRESSKQPGVGTRLVIDGTLLFTCKDPDGLFSVTTACLGRRYEECVATKDEVYRLYEKHYAEICDAAARAHAAGRDVLGPEDFS